MKLPISTVFIFAFLCLQLNTNAQNCSAVSGKKDKKENIETFSGLATSTDHYSMLIGKKVHYKDTAIAPQYFLYLVAASSVLFSDSKLNTTGIMKLTLSDSTTLTLEGVTFKNNPLGIGTTLGFNVYVTSEQFKHIAATPIVSLTVSELTTSFTEKTQLRQQQIINCLLSK